MSNRINSRKLVSISLAALAISLAVSAPRSWAKTPQPQPALKPSINQSVDGPDSYICPNGSKGRKASDLKGGDMRSHQTKSGYTCLDLSKPDFNKQTGGLVCPKGTIHHLSDLNFTVLPKYYQPNTAYTCVQGFLPSCANNYHPSPSPMSDQSICVVNTNY